MKKIIFIVSLILCGFGLKAQTIDPDLDKLAIKDPAPKIDSSQIMKSPEFDGGFENFQKFIYTHINRRDHYVGVLKVSFIVQEDGSITNPEIHEGNASEDTKRQILRAIRLSPKWTPGIVRGKISMVTMIVPLIFDNNN